MYLSPAKAYLFIYNDIVGTREAVQAVLDNMTTVSTWRYDMPNVFYIISSSSAQELSQEFERKLSDRGRYIFVEYSDNAQGRLTEETWYLLNNKTHKPTT